MKPSAFHSLLAGPFCRWSLLALVFSILLNADAAVPAWWTARGVMDPGQTVNDYAAANVGQLKHIAQKAMDEMDAELTGGAGTAIHTLVDSWDTIQPDTNDYAAVNIGQVKAVAKLFYQRLNAAGYTQPLPWNDSDPERNDYAAANIGQIKAVFAFCIECGSSEDTDADGIADWWELQKFGNLTASGASSDHDDDGITDLIEFLLGTDPAATASHQTPSVLGLSLHTRLIRP